jgi:hypothetical protein
MLDRVQHDINTQFNSIINMNRAMAVILDLIWDLRGAYSSLTFFLIKK